MFQYRKLIFLSDTDATGVLYFSEQLKWAGEAFEAFLTSQKISLKEMIKKRDFLLPVVHVEGDYHLPLFVGDEVTIQLSLEAVGTSSFTLHAHTLKEGKEAGDVKVTHVAVDPTSSEAMPVPERVLTVLRQL